MTGTLFDIQEFPIHDGPGLRIVVFLKGCPLRCQWCHNPEGLSPSPQEFVDSGGRSRPVGFVLSAEELAGRIDAEMPFLMRHGGGATFSGGEPLAQAPFVAETIRLLGAPRHLILETSGYAEAGQFDETSALFDEVYFDLKPVDEAAHRKYTGVGNAMVLRNLRALASSGRPYTVRIPLIPGVTDTEGNLRSAAELCSGLLGARRFELMPYNEMAGGKYRGLGYEYSPEFDPRIAPDVDRARSAFASRGLEVSLP